MFLIYLIIFGMTLRQTSSSNVTHQAQDNIAIGIVIVHEKEQPDIPTMVADAVKKVSAKFKGVSINEYYIPYDRERLQFGDDEQFCDALSQGVSILLDVTWIDSRYISSAAEEFGIPYFHIDLSIQTYVKLMESFLLARGGNDVVYILPTRQDVDATIYLLIADSYLRAIVFGELDEDTVVRIKNLRPYPSFYAVVADTMQMNAILHQAIDSGLVRKPEKWNLLFTDLQTDKYAHGDTFPEMHRLMLDRNACCILLRQLPACECPDSFDPTAVHLENALDIILGWSIDSVPTLSVRAINCTPELDQEEVARTSAGRKELLRQMALMAQFWIAQENDMIRPNLNLSIISTLTNQIIGSVTQGQSVLAGNETFQPSKRFFRVGTTESIPWAYRKRDSVGNILRNPITGEPIWEGYCIDFLHQLSIVMNFDYDLVSPRNGTFGQRDPDGRWDGLVGDLVTGEIDFAIASLKMTAEREEVVDFVAPYYEQTGILIAMRKPVRETSLFKFMTVLRLEVWLSILLAIVATAVMLWLLDKFSPYSAKNNKDAYPYECRNFTLKESFWFALTSFTPQGGGEAPKALSGRTLVAAYWLFVVLMLATFTANLAAFLTVERMQTPVQSLEQLSRQSRIKYTVVKDSDTHDYFRNMKNAEDVLYQMWRNLTLSSGNDQAQYRVWDYPIKEQYINILSAIESAEPVATAADGFRRVNEHLDADFAFIHDSAEIRYEISRNCNFTEVGEVFAEQPYGIAVQQGSHLQDELSYFILELQKERYFESLTAKFWNNSARSHCPNTDDSEGITLESLGGVFIATLVGLALAMITLLGEVIYYRRKERSRNFIKVVPFGNVDRPIERSDKRFALKEKSIAVVKQLLDLDTAPPPVKARGAGGPMKIGTKKEKPIPKEITIGSKFVSAAEKQQKLSYIAIMPRNPIH
ncbi:glutamate receptor ionotropic, kainate 2 [Anopheles maculipalpis]|uniref:glutamate receptor ionotropic, kainate 2 n=1 Tax=Anopheles maculipalpis TaxID=1496333 RepID=UPI002158C5E5|nr:glutamate receptor ionotropic, kainate 2 [Anopheles maculipalpis]